MIPAIVPLIFSRGSMAGMQIQARVGQTVTTPPLWLHQAFAQGNCW